MLKAIFAAGVLAGFSIGQDTGSGRLALGRVLEPRCRMLHERQSPCTPLPQFNHCLSSILGNCSQDWSRARGCLGGVALPPFQPPHPHPCPFGHPIPPYQLHQDSRHGPSGLAESPGEAEQPGTQRRLEHDEDGTSGGEPSTARARWSQQRPPLTPLHLPVAQQETGLGLWSGSASPSGGPHPHGRHRGSPPSPPKG